VPGGGKTVQMVRVNRLARRNPVVFLVGLGQGVHPHVLAARQVPGLPRAQRQARAHVLAALVARVALLRLRWPRLKSQP
jgi:hypothetical protein